MQLQGTATDSCTGLLLSQQFSRVSVPHVTDPDIPTLAIDIDDAKTTDLTTCPRLIESTMNPTLSRRLVVVGHRRNIVDLSTDRS